MNLNRDEIDRDIKIANEMEALITEREGMIAENQAREHRDESMAYTELDFRRIAASIRALIPRKIEPALPVDELAEAVKAMKHDVNDWIYQRQRSLSNIHSEDIDKIIDKYINILRDTLMKRIKEQAETIAALRELEERLNAPEPEELVKAREEYYNDAVGYLEIGGLHGKETRAYTVILKDYIDQLESYIELLKGRK